MGEPIEGLYFNWLCAKVLPGDTSGYCDLMRILYKTEFVWSISGDRNREEDGLELRIDFLRETDWENEAGWYHSPCSVFEVFIAFAKRASFQTDTPVNEWFWIFMANLRLDQYRQVSKPDIAMIDRIINTFLWRIYDPSGYGGMFPLREPKHDQREVEIWYQFCEYLEDQGLI